MKTLVHAFVSSRLDYCNSLLAGTSDYLLQKLQRVQNVAARLVTGRGSTNTSHQCSGNFTGYPSGSGYNTRPLYWCTSVDTPPLHRISLTSVYQRRRFAAVTGCGRSRYRLRSTDADLLYVPRTHTSYCDRSFAVRGPSARQSGTVCLLAYVLLTLLHPASFITFSLFPFRLKTRNFFCISFPPSSTFPPIGLTPRTSAVFRFSRACRF